MVSNTRQVGNVKILMVGGGGGSMPADPLPVDHGGTGNTVGYIQTGQRDGETIGTNATSEGTNNIASGQNSHAEGSGTQATGYGSHSEGSFTVASGTCAHAQGNSSVASGDDSFASGLYLEAGYDYQTVVGKNNSNKSTTLFEVGNGTQSSLSNAFEVYSDGKISQDNGSTKFKFGNNGTSDGYYDASGTFHAFGSGGSSTLSGLTDTNISSPSNGQVLGYNSTSQKWENQTPSGGGGGGYVPQYCSVDASRWSASQNANGYYTQTITLSVTFNSNIPPVISLAGSSSGLVLYTDSEESMYEKLNYVASASNTQVTLYAKEKPSSTFYVWLWVKLT